MSRPTPVDVVSEYDQQAIIMALQVAVPLWVAKMRSEEWTREHLESRAAECGNYLSERGDSFQFPSKRGDAASGFNRLAEGIACLSTLPGGVEFLGIQWQS